MWPRNVASESSLGMWPWNVAWEGCSTYHPFCWLPTYVWHINKFQGVGYPQPRGNGWSEGEVIVLIVATGRDPIETGGAGTPFQTELKLILTFGCSKRITRATLCILTQAISVAVQPHSESQSRPSQLLQVDY